MEKEFYNEPTFQAQQKRIAAFCDLFAKLDGTYEEHMQALTACIFQNAFEPGKASEIVAELRSVIAQIRAGVLGEPHIMGFARPEDVEAVRVDANADNVEIITCKRAVEIAREVMTPAPDQTVLFYAWLKK